MPTKNGIIILLVVAVVAIATILGYLYLGQEKTSPVSVPSPAKTSEITPPPATGNVDDAANAILKELLDEDQLLIEEESDISLITNDSQEIGDFGQAVNESKL